MIFSLTRSFLLLVAAVFVSATSFAQTTTAKIAVGINQSMVLSEDGSVYTFGAGNFGSTGQPVKRIDIPGLAEDPALAGQKIADFAVGKEGTAHSADHLLILLADGRIFGLGDNSKNQLVISGPTKISTLTQITHPNFTGHTIVDVEAADSRSFFRTDEGKVFVVGDNLSGAIGLGVFTNPIVEPTLLTSMSDKHVTKIVTSSFHTFLFTNDGQIWAFGTNLYGELGIGNTTSQISPVRVDHLFPDPNETITKIVAHFSHSFFITASGKVYSAGLNFSPIHFEEVSGGNTITPTLMTHPNIAGKMITDIAVNADNKSSVWLASDGTVFSYASSISSSYLALGRDPTDIYSPIQITKSGVAQKTIVEIGGAGSNFMYLKASDGSMFAYGGFNSGLNTSNPSYLSFSSGTGRGGAIEPFPRVVNLSQMPGKSVAKMITSSPYVYFLTADSLLYTFGFGEPKFHLGLSLRSDPTVASPTLLQPSSIGGKKARNIFAGGKQSYVQTEDNQIYHFGQNSFGQLGRPDSIDHFAPVLFDASLIDNNAVRQVVVGQRDSLTATFFLTENGEVYAFGANHFGQLGLGDNIRRSQPTKVTHANLSGKKIIHIASNGASTLFVADDGTAFTFGYGENGFLGHGTSVNLNVPTPLTHATVAAKQIISGSVGGTISENFFALITSDGKIISFGEGSDGELGHDDKLDSEIPRIITHASIDQKKIIKASSGLEGTIVLASNGEIFGFGQAAGVGFAAAPWTDYDVPTLINSAGITGRIVVDVASNDEHTQLLLDNGTVLAAGRNGGGTTLNKNAGVLGAADPIPYNRVHTAVPNFTTYVSPIPTTNLSMHLNANRIGYISDNNLIDKWLNFADSTKNATQSLLISRPLLVDSVINNQKALRFNGINTYLISPTTTDLGIQNSDYEIFVVAKSAGPTTAIQFLLAGSAENMELHTNGIAGIRYIPTPGNYIDQGSIGSYTDGNPHLVNMRATNTYANATVNRVNSTQVAVNARSADVSQLFVGVRQGGTFWYNGDIAEVIIYNAVLSAADRVKVESYLLKKYAIQNYKESSLQLTGSEGWRILSSPVVDSSLAPLLGPLWTQGFTGADDVGGSANVYRWSNTSSDNNAANWAPVSNMNTAVSAGEGFLVYVYSDDNGINVAGNAGFPKTITLEGREPAGSQSLSSKLNPNLNGWALLGNPFRSDIAWNATTKTGISNAVYVYDNNGPQWRTWNGNAGDLTEGEIGPFNAFFIQTTGADPSLEIPENAKRSTSARFLGKETQESQTLLFSLELNSSSGLSNSVWFQFSQDAQTGWDNSDAFQLSPLASNYVTIASVLNDSTHLDINNLPLVGEVLEIPLAIETTESEIEHTISRGKWNIPQDWDVVLYDSERGVESSLDQPYAFTSEPVMAKTPDGDQLPSMESIFNTSRKKQAPPRFTLIITPSTALSSEAPSLIPQTVELKQNYPNPFNPTTTISYGLPEQAHVHLAIFDMLGRSVAQLVNKPMSAGRYAHTFDASSLSSGLYIYRLQVGATVMTKKMILIK